MQDKKILHEVAILKDSKAEANTNLWLHLPSPAPPLLFLTPDQSRIALSKMNYKISSSSHYVKSGCFLTLDLWSDVRVWILISVSFFISRQLLPLKMETWKCMPEIRYLSVPLGLCDNTFWWRQYSHQMYDAMAHWAASVYPGIDLYLRNIICTMITQFSHTQKYFRPRNYFLVYVLLSSFHFGSYFSSSCYLFIYFIKYH